jgi:hypothetical protein
MPMRISILLDDSTLDQLVSGHGRIGGFIDSHQKEDVAAVTDIVRWLVETHSGQLTTAIAYRNYQGSLRDQQRAYRDQRNINSNYRADGEVSFKI